MKNIILFYLGNLRFHLVTIVLFLGAIDNYAQQQQIYGYGSAGKIAKFSNNYTITNSIVQEYNDKIGIGVSQANEISSKLTISSSSLSYDPVCKIYIPGLTGPSIRHLYNENIEQVTYTYGFYQSGETLLNTFEGSLGIGVAFPVCKLDVLGSGNFSNLLSSGKGLILGGELPEGPPSESPYIQSNYRLDFRVISNVKSGTVGDILSLINIDGEKIVGITGHLSTNSFQITDNKGLDKVLVSDQDGNGTWTDQSLIHDDDWLVTRAKAEDPPPPVENSIYLNTTKYKSVLIGTEITPAGYKLAVNGKILCEELDVKLNADWPDYVFGKNYKLPSILETDQYIHDNGKLPGVPSSEEVKKDGVKVGEMNVILLKKIEELTLYVISLKKEIEDLKADRSGN